MSLIGTTLKLWLFVPERPSFWLCGLVAWTVLRAKPNYPKMGSIVLDDDVEYDHHATDA
jgi:hypothetical protein